MKLSEWMPLERDLLAMAHDAWGGHAPGWSEILGERYGPRGTAGHLFGDLDEMRRKQVLAGALSDYVRTGKPFSVAAIDGFVGQSARTARIPRATRSSAALERYHPPTDPHDPASAAEGLRLCREVLGRYGCGCRLAMGRRSGHPDCRLDHGGSDAILKGGKT